VRERTHQDRVAAQDEQVHAAHRAAGAEQGGEAQHEGSGVAVEAQPGVPARPPAAVAVELRDDTKPAWSQGGGANRKHQTSMEARGRS